MRVIWTPQAILDLKTVREYIERDSPLYARLVTERLYNAVGQLISYPESGRIVPELGRPAIRELVRGSYRIVYRIDSDATRVLTVVHTAQLFPKNLE